jgi:isochorismate synthase EntC
MRRELAISQEVLKRLALIDKKLLEHDNVIEDLVQNLIPLLEEPPAPEKPAMGFHP